jgi:PA14 domain
MYGDVCDPAPIPVYGLMTDFFGDEKLETLIARRLEPRVDINTGEGKSFWKASRPEGIAFSARWTGWITVPVSGSYTFYLTANDGAKLWINDQLLLNRWIYRSHPLMNSRCQCKLGSHTRSNSSSIKILVALERCSSGVNPGQPKRVILRTVFKQQ